MSSNYWPCPFVSIILWGDMACFYHCYPCILGNPCHIIAADKIIAKKIEKTKRNCGTNKKASTFVFRQLRYLSMFAVSIIFNNCVE